MLAATALDGGCPENNDRVLKGLFVPLLSPSLCSYHSDPSQARVQMCHCSLSGGLSHLEQSQIPAQFGSPQQLLLRLLSNSAPHSLHSRPNVLSPATLTLQTKHLGYSCPKELGRLRLSRQFLRCRKVFLNHLTLKKQQHPIPHIHSPVILRNTKHTWQCIVEWVFTGCVSQPNKTHESRVCLSGETVHSHMARTVPTP